MIHFTVYGRPQPAGSKRVFLNKRTGKPIVTDTNPNAKAWKQEVAAAALANENGGQMDGPLVLSVTFFLARPKSHLTTTGLVRSSAPVHPTVRPDATKLVRGLEDALNGIAWRDDSQVVCQHIDKCYAEPGEPERCDVEVYPA